MCVCFDNEQCYAVPPPDHRGYSYKFSRHIYSGSILRTSF